MFSIGLFFYRARCFDLVNVAPCNRVWYDYWVPDAGISEQETCAQFDFFSVAPTILTLSTLLPAAVYGLAGRSPMLVSLYKHVG